MAASNGPRGSSASNPVHTASDAIYPTSATPVAVASGNVDNASAVSALTAVAAKTNYISGFEVTGAGATTGAVVLVTVAGVLGGTLTYTYAAAAEALIMNSPLIVRFNPPIPASAVNTAITLTVPALGVGNTNSAAVIHGYVV